MEALVLRFLLIFQQSVWPFVVMPNNWDLVAAKCNSASLQFKSTRSNLPCSSLLGELLARIPLLLLKVGSESADCGLVTVVVGDLMCCMQSCIADPQEYNWPE